MNFSAFLAGLVSRSRVMGTQLAVLILIISGLAAVCGCVDEELAVVRPVRPEPPVEVPSLPEVEQSAVAPSQQPDEPAPIEKASRPEEIADVNDEPREKKAPELSFNENLSEFFDRYVDARGMVDYKRLRPGRLELIQVMREFDQLSPKEYDSWPEPEKIAFWINAYNLCTIKVVIDNYPIQASRYMTLFYPANSIRQISKPWTEYDFSIMNVKYTLREIDRRILARQFDEPRVCFALSYASMDGPRLRNEPYTGKKLEQQLDEQVRNFIHGERGFRIGRGEKEVYLSATFKWYENLLAGKFGTDRKFIDKEPGVRAVLNFISNYISRADRDFLERKSYSVEYMKYDWTLNEQ
jgi:hypothetical protein